MKLFDIAVIGAGHAGIEAAFIAAQFKLKIGLLTLPNVPIASAPCNPAVGGVGKGQVVKEIDALGGVMAKLADKAAIHYRILNESKGYAVRSTRVQIDKEVYSENAREMVDANQNIELVLGKVNAVSIENGLFRIEINQNKTIHSKKLIVTAGTFLSGVLHTGAEQVCGGRIGHEASDGLDKIFKKVKGLQRKFKTGTPPRLKKDSVCFDKMDKQPSDDRAMNFHWFHVEKSRFLPQSVCYLTRTNEKTLALIRENKEKSPIFNGQIQGIGPRYCPSIEDKAFRYPDRQVHHVFVEPEGLNLETLYPNGLSTSLPREIQDAFIQTIDGFEQAKIEVYGHAVEYDVVDTTQLSRTLECKEISGLYFAGQINGTSGYEEAAGQGLIAGINAALSLKNQKPLILDRTESYIGVMIEDLVTNFRDEPYRLFTARSENRLFIREDNTFSRIFPYRMQMELDGPLDLFHVEHKKEVELLSGLCDSFFYNQKQWNQYFLERGYAPLFDRISLSELLKQSQLDPVVTLTHELNQFGVRFSSLAIAEVAITKKYQGYIDRSHIELDKMKKLSSLKIDWEALTKSPNISFECKQRISAIKPDTFGQLKMIKGIRPATLALVAGTNF